MTARPAPPLGVATFTLFAAQAARAQAPAPSLLVIGSTLRQVGEELQFGVRFNRALPVRDLQPRRGRSICVVLSPDARSRWRVCVSRSGGRLRATLARVDGTGSAAGAARPVRDARIIVRGAVLTAERRGRTTVRSDAHISSGISKPGILEWVRRARAQASSFKPDVTVIFLGATTAFRSSAGRAATKHGWPGTRAGCRR